MLAALARLATRRPKRVLAATFVVFLVAVVFGGPVAGLLNDGDAFSDPDAESLVTAERLADAAGANPRPSYVALVRPGAPVGSAAGRRAVRRVERELESVPEVARAVTASEAGERALVSRDGRSAVVLGFLRPRADEGRANDAVVARLGETPGVTLGGGALTGVEVGEQVGKDLARAEMIAFPILFLLSLFVFRSVVAALLPLFVGVLTIFGTFLGLRLVNEAAELSIFALNLTIALGLGLAIDYSLFVVSRYREEVARTGPGVDAVRATLGTAGRTVIFSALTVATALLSLVVFPQQFLYSMGIAGALAALLAGAVSLVALPALLAVLGPRVDALALPGWRRHTANPAADEGHGFWYRLSRAVMRRPGPVALATTIVLVVLGLSFARVEFTGVDSSVLPEGAEPRQVDETVRAQFPPAPTEPITVALEAPRSEGAAVRGYAASLGRLDGVAGVLPVRALGPELWQVDVVPRHGVLDERTLSLVRDVRAAPAPASAQVAGQSARFVDQQAGLRDRLPVALAILVLTTLVILWIMTGSVVLPVKALLMNALTLAGAFGVLVLVFQDGRFEGLLDYTSQGALEATQPLVLAALAFGLSTDYGVFLLARIKEARDAGADNEEAVALGLERTGRIVTAAALLLSVALGAFATSQIVFIKEVGVGTVAAVLIDATIIRALLMPSLMKLLGEWNWWAPAPLRRLHRRVEVSEA